MSCAQTLSLSSPQPDFVLSVLFPLVFHGAIFLKQPVSTERNASKDFHRTHSNISSLLQTSAAVCSNKCAANPPFTKSEQLKPLQTSRCIIRSRGRPYEHSRRFPNTYFRSASRVESRNDSSFIFPLFEISGLHSVST